MGTTRELTAAGLGAAAAAAAVTALWLRRPPPWFLARWMAPEVRRGASDASSKQAELLARPHRQPLTLYLIRHGQSQANTKMHLVGGRDVASPLTAKGAAQAQAVGRRLAKDGLRFDRIYASHAVRARRTAELACNELGVPASTVQVEQRVVEFSQGRHELQPRSEVYAPDGPVMRGITAERMFYRPPGISPDGDRGESQHDVELRFRAFVDELQATQEGPLTVAVFSHGIAIKSFVRGLIGADVDFTVHAETGNCSLTVLEYKPALVNLGGWVLRCFNA